MGNINKGSTINDRFMLVEHLGNGTFSQVWRAFDERLDSDVALKIYTPLTHDGMKELKREYSNTMGVAHQNLLTAHGMDVFPEGAYMVMKYCANGSAGDLAGMVDEPTVWAFVRDVASGLSYLHGLEVPLVHQDLKLNNIMIDDEERFLISDFGVCSKVTQIMVRQTGRGREAQTAYMSPERFGDYPEPLTASDIWTFGAIVYQLVTGRLPFDRFGGASQRKGVPVPLLPPGWSGELQCLIDTCLSLETWDRPTASKIKEYAVQKLRGQLPNPVLLGLRRHPTKAERSARQQQASVEAFAHLMQQLNNEPAPQPESPQPAPFVPVATQPTTPQPVAPQPATAQQAAETYAQEAVENTFIPAASEPQPPVFIPEKIAEEAPAPIPAPANEPEAVFQPNDFAGNEVPAYLNLATGGGGAGMPPTGGNGTNAAYDEGTHFTSGTRYRGGAAARRVVRHKHRGPVKKAWDWLKGKSSIISFLMAVAICIGVYIYGIDNLIGLKWLPKKEKSQTGYVEESVQIVPSNVAVATDDDSVPKQPVGEFDDITKRMMVQNADRSGMPQPPVDKYADNRGATFKDKGKAVDETKAPEKDPEKTQPQKESKEEPKKEVKEQNTDKKGNAPSPQANSDVSSAMQRGDYKALKSMADNGNAAAQGAMARYYFRQHNYDEANRYAQKAKSGGDPAGIEVINQLTTIDYYE